MGLVGEYIVVFEFVWFECVVFGYGDVVFDDLGLIGVVYVFCVCEWCIWLYV